MSFWLQHGHGKSDKIDVLCEQGLIEGVILSPANEKPTVLAATAHSVKEFGVRVLLDPQTYVYSVTDGAARYHDDHGLEFAPLHWTMSPSAVTAHVEAVLAANKHIGTADSLIAPSCLQRSFDDAWAALAFQFAQTAANMVTDRELFVSLVVADSGFSDWDEVNRWLDAATTLKADGFYLIVAGDGRGYPTATTDPFRLRNVLSLIYRLSVLNEYQVLWAYSDFLGILGLAAGATGAASGWHYSLRQFSEDKWKPAGFGRPPNARVTSPLLMAPLEAEAETTAVLNTTLAGNIFPSQGLRAFFEENGATAWTRAQAQVQHLEVLASIAKEITEHGNVSDRLDDIQERLAGALSGFDELERRGVALATGYQAKISAFIEAVAAFRELERI